MANHDDDRGLDRAELDRWLPPEPRATFADDVMARLDARGAFTAPASSPPAPRRIPMAALVGFAIGAAAMLVIVMVVGRERGAGAGRGFEPAGGRIEAAARRTLAIGARAVAVAEAGSELEWRIEANGRASVVQHRGSVFYRVDPGGPFRVATPHGEITVLGTCFTVAVDTATTWVTTHEGRVVVAGPSTGATLVLEAGEAAVLEPTGPRRIDLDRAPTAAPSTARAGASLIPPRPAAPPSDDGDDTTDRAALFETNPATLARWADECRIRVDLPPITDARTTEQELDELAAQIRLRPHERAALRAAVAAIRERTIVRLRRLYLDATGDEDGARTLGAETLLHEVMRTAELREEGELRQRIARERAGLESPPPVSASLSPLEEAIRILTRLGDEFEAELARTLGPARARELRRARHGWPSSEFHWFGCPER